MIGIINYDAGNLTSVKRALDYLAIPGIVSSDPEELGSCERIIFPGVGNAASAMVALKKRGLDKALKVRSAAAFLYWEYAWERRSFFRAQRKAIPSVSESSRGKCRKLIVSNRALKIPHMGWNEITIVRPHYILKDIVPKSQFYFVHSFFPQPGTGRWCMQHANTVAYFPAPSAEKNIFATQFHLEKAGALGWRC